MKWIGLVLLSVLPLAAGNDDTFMIHGATLHPVAGAEMENGSVLVKDGKIAGVGRNLTPPKGVRVIEGKGLHVYPGLIDSGTEIGLSEISSTRESVDTGELGKFDPQLRAEVAINPASEHIPVTRANGTTSVISLPLGSSGARGDGIITGQATLVHLDGWTWEEMEIKKSAGMTMRMPTLLFFGMPFTEAKKNHETELRELKEFFEAARRYQKAKTAKAKDFQADLKYEAMLPVLEGHQPLVITAPRERAIREALQFADQQKVRVIISGPRELGKLGPELKARGIPAILGPTLALPLNEDDPYDAAYTLPNQFFQAGVKFAMASFNNQFARNLPYQAATAVAFGLPYEEALKAVTLNPAQIWGVADAIGSIEEGKWADLMVTDGDPLEARTQDKQLFIKGRAVDLDNRQKRLYEKYSNRP
jgi:imidazolonepropionase-like amidohydrolase